MAPTCTFSLGLLLLVLVAPTGTKHQARALSQPFIYPLQSQTDHAYRFRRKLGRNTGFISKQTEQSHQPPRNKRYPTKLGTSHWGIQSLRRNHKNYKRRCCKMNRRMTKNCDDFDSGEEHDMEEAEGGPAEPLSLSTSDLERLASARKYYKTVPIMILDAMLPGQCLDFGSPDQKFRRLIEHSLEREKENPGEGIIGMIGFNPHTGRPLNVGVTLSITPQNVKMQPMSQSQFITREGQDDDEIIVISVQGQDCFEVQGEPWMDETESFYLADVHIVSNQKECLDNDEDAGSGGKKGQPVFSDLKRQQAKKLSSEVPPLVEKWLDWVIDTGKSDRLGMEKRMKDIGPMPDNVGKRAIWVAALINPLPPLGVCLEIRPAMLACTNDYDRIQLAVAAIQSSIDHLSGKRRLF